jgi:hypothetical protein
VVLVGWPDRWAEVLMWRDMFVEQIPLAEKILRTVIVYASLAVLFRLTGKRGLANLNTFDFIVLTLKAAEQNATKADVAALTDRLLRIEGLLTTRR